MEEPEVQDCVRRLEYRVQRPNQERLKQLDTQVQQWKATPREEEEEEDSESGSSDEDDEEEEGWEDEDEEDDED
eukprot:2994348-Rhodomonas_salina.1